MKKVLSVIASAVIVFLGIAFLDRSLAYAANCGNLFPTSLNNYVSGCTIPSAWGNALESKIGVTSSTATSSLDYQINHIFTSYGSEVIATSALPGQVLFNTSLSATNPVVYNSSTGVFSWTNSNNYIPLTALSAIGPIVYNSSTGIFSWTNSNNYIGLSSLSASTPLVYNSTTGAFSFANSGVTSGTYNWPSLTIASSGIVTSASSNSTPVTSISGTANQITASDSTGAVSLSIPSQLNVTNISASGNVTTTGITNSGVKNALILANSSGAHTSYGGATCTGSQVIQGLSATGTPSCITVATSSASSAAGTSTNIQYNYQGVMSATSTLSVNMSTPGIIIGNNVDNYSVAPSLLLGTTDSSGGGNGNVNCLYTHFTASKTGTLNYLMQYDYQGGYSSVGALYSNNSGQPGTLLATTSAATTVNGYTQMQFTTPPTVTSGTVYWLATLGNSAYFSQAFAVATATNYYQSCSYPTFPATASGLSSDTQILTVSGITDWNVTTATTTPTQKYSLNLQDHIDYTASSSPTLSSCGGGGFPNFPSVLTGSDSRGIVTIGSGNPTSCTINFSHPFDNPPAGWATPISATGIWSTLASDSTTSATFDFWTVSNSTSSPGAVAQTISQFLFGFDGY